MKYSSKNSNKVVLVEFSKAFIFGQLFLLSFMYILNNF